MTGPPPEVVAAPGTVVDPLVADRLRRALDAAADGVAGVAALVAPLAPGTSDRTDAEWSAVGPPSTSPAPGGPLVGAVAVRATAAHRVGPYGVTVDGVVLVDHGARCHDPGAAPLPPGPAVPEGRPPFPCRPVVLVASHDDDPDALAWAGRTADALLPLDVEVRVATRSTDVPTRRTRPCLPEPGAIEALRPDVVIALDPTAERLADAWCQPLRGTCLVRWDPHVDVALVPWRLGVADGRVRAVVGPTAAVGDLADLVHRLAAGPLPGLPRDEPTPVAVRRAPRPRPLRPAAQLALVPIHGDEASQRRCRAIRDAAVEAGASVRTLDPDDPGRAALDAELLVLVGAAAPPATADVLAERLRDGRPCLVEVRRADLDGDVTGAGDAVAELLPAAEAAVATVGRAAFASASLRHRTVLGPVPRRIVPTPLPDATAREVEALGQEPAPGELVVAWHVGAAPVDDATTEAAAEGLARAAGDRHDLRLELLGAPAATPTAWFDDERSSARASAPTPRQAHRWSLLLATPSVVELLDGELGALQLAAGLGRPVVWASRVGAAEPWLPPPVEDLTDPDAWAAVLAPLLEDPAARRSAGAAAQAGAGRTVGAGAAEGLLRRLAALAEERR